MQLDPYLNFNGRCDEAIEFYKKALGAEVGMITRFKDCPDKNMPIKPEAMNKVMHASLKVGDSNLLMSDGQCKADGRFEGISMSLTVKSEAEAKKVFESLTAGGKVTMPLGKTFFASSFGMGQDRFGVGWMVIAH